MNTRKQSGSAHVVIIIILVVTLLGTLGYIFWQKVSENNAAKTTTTTETTKDTDSTKEPETTNTDLSLEKWSVSVPIKDFTATYTVSSESSVGDYYQISTAEIEDYAKKINCDDIFIGSVARTNNAVGFNQEFNGGVAKIGEYYYIYTPRSQAACAPTDGGSNPQFDEYNQIMTDAIASFKAAIVKTAAN